jgi:hypothetical protein
MNYLYLGKLCDSMACIHEYKATPYFYKKKISFLTRLNMSFSSKSCEQKEVKTTLLRNNKLKLRNNKFKI